MRKIINLLSLIIVCLLINIGCDVSKSSGAKIAASNSYIESAIIDIIGREEKVLRLAEPGMCPGHFDIQPSQASQMNKCKVLFKFDFQKLFEEQLSKGATNPVVVSVKANGGLCCPQTYLDITRQVAKALINLGLIESSDKRLIEIESRLQELEKQCRAEIAKAGLKGAPVLSSVRQKEFCDWLGLDVVGTFTAADITGFNEIEKAIAVGKFKNVKFIIANKPEGRRLADALAERLNAKVVVFGNFPEDKDGVSFDAMVLNNVAALINPDGK